MTAALATRAGRFYNGTDGRELVVCPDCGREADALFGDHGQQCAHPLAVNPHSALGIIRKHALHNRRFSANDVRHALDSAGINENSRGPAFAAAVRKDYCEPDGYVKSTDGPTKGHPVQTYTSKIYEGADV